MIEEKQRQAMQEAAENTEQADKSFDAEDMNKTGEMSKLSNKEDTARKSKDKTVE